MIGPKWGDGLGRQEGPLQALPVTLGHTSILRAEGKALNGQMNPCVSFQSLFQQLVLFFVYLQERGAHYATRERSS